MTFSRLHPERGGGFDTLFADVSPLMVERPPAAPQFFYVTIDEVNLAWSFFVSDYANTSRRTNRASYSIYFCPISFATPAQMSNQGVSTDAFNNSVLIVSGPAPPRGGDVRFTSASHFGEDGWFFCTSRSPGLLEGPFNGPVRSPVIQTDLNNAIPPEVTDPTITKTDVVINGQTVAKLDFSAIIPAEFSGVIAISMTNQGTGYTSVPDVAFSGGDGTGAAGFATVDLTAGIVTGVTITSGGRDYSNPPTIAFTGGGGSGAAATASIGQSSIFSGYQLYIRDYFEGISPTTEESVSVARNFTLPAGQALTGTLYLLPDNPPFSNNVTFYFVSLSPSGRRRLDPENAPSFTIVGGIT